MDDNRYRECPKDRNVVDDLYINDKAVCNDQLKALFTEHYDSIFKGEVFLVKAKIACKSNNVRSISKCNKIVYFGLIKLEDLRNWDISSINPMVIREMDKPKLQYVTVSDKKEDCRLFLIASRLDILRDFYTLLNEAA